MIERKDWVMCRLIMLQVLCLFFIAPTILCANEPPEKVLEKFNASLTGKEAIEYLAGSMKSQFASLDENKQKEWLEYSRMGTYQAQTKSVNDDVQFVFVNDVESADGEKKKLDYPIIYQFLKTDDQWKIEERWSGYIILDLFKQKVSPMQFHGKNLFQFNEEKVAMESAFAFIGKNKHDFGESQIHIKFYPFPFQERDIEFLKQDWGPSVEDTDKATAIASSIKYPRGELDVHLDEKDQIISVTLMFQYFVKGDTQLYSLNFQDGSLINKFDITENNLSLITKGNHQMFDGKMVSWDINVDLPLFKEGIE